MPPSPPSSAVGFPGHIHVVCTREGLRGVQGTRWQRACPCTTAAGAAAPAQPAGAPPCPAPLGVTWVPWGCRCAWCGCTPSLPHARGAVGVGVAGLGAPSPGQRWVPGDGYRPACRLRLWFPAGAGGDGAGEPLGLPGGCRAPPGAGMMAAIRLGPPTPVPGALCWPGMGWPQWG